MEKYSNLFAQKLQEVYDSLEASHIRNAQRKMYLCAAKCCENVDQTDKDINHCIEQCNVPLINMQTYLKNEFDYVQNRLQRCIMNCNDAVKDKIESTPRNVVSNLDSQYKQEFEECSINCINKHIQMLPSVLFKIKSTLDKQEV